MRRFLIITYIVTGVTIFNIALFGTPLSSVAQDFFETLYDVPVMTGMREIDEEAMAFDKPAGRIAKAVGVIVDSDEAAVKAYYDESLAQMGWQETSALEYVRKEERLTINVSKSSGYGDRAVIVSFRIEPVQ